MPIQSADVYIRHTGTIKGRGAFAARGHAKDEVVERCPVLLFEGSFSSVPEAVRQVLFNWGVLAGTRHQHCLALGYGSLYNHANPANMRYEADAQGGALNFVAVRDIGAGEELTINYNAVGGGPVSDQDTWFGGMGITVFDDKPA